MIGLTDLNQNSNSMYCEELIALHFTICMVFYLQVHFTRYTPSYIIRPTQQLCSLYVDILKR